MNWYQLTLDELFKKLRSNQFGLTTKEAALRMQHYGLNEIHEQKKCPPHIMFLNQFRDFMIIVLILSATIAGFFGDIIDTFIILLIVLINAIIGFVQEYKAEKAMEALNRMAAIHAVVIRNRIPTTLIATDIVPGDVVLLEAGNVVPADLRIVENHQLKVDEASLTGESIAVEKDSAPIGEESIALGDRKNIAFKGTNVVNGRGKGIVVATGMNTELGKIASLMTGDEVKTPLQKRLAVFGKNLAMIVLAICTIVFTVGLIRGEKPLLMLLTSISLAVAAIPEALPAVVTIALAIGAKKMVRQNALVRKLPAVETLGSVTYICSDKTGTLTQNKMIVEEVYIDGTNFYKKDALKETLNEKEKLIFMAMALSNDVSDYVGSRPIGDSTEIALLEMARAQGFNKNELEQLFPRVAEIPFDPERKCMTTIHKFNGEYISFTKGALDVLLQKTIGLTNEEKEKLLQTSQRMAADGLRVLAFFIKKTDKLPFPILHEKIESELTILGTAGLFDPPRQEVKQAIDECKTAGIKPVMITGDHPLTAYSIAKRLGIIESEDDKVFTGVELTAKSLQEFEEKVDHIKVYARVSPEQKLKIVKVLQNRGQFVAMTGDGVNDAPSLKKADIGIAMGINGTDVSKEAAHLILLDDNFATIVKAVKSGRRIFDNIRKFIKYTMTSNSGEIWTIFLAPLLGLPLPLLPVHILWINLVTDGLPGLALAAEPAEKGIMKRPPRPPNENIFAKGLGTHILWVGILMGSITIISQALEIRLNNPNWQTMVFTVLCLSQIGHVLAIRSETQSFFSQGPLSNKPLLGAAILTFILQLCTIYIPFLNTVFKTAPLSLHDLFITIGLSSVVFVAVEFEKIFKRALKNRAWGSGMLSANENI
ncbi:cation-translocating P-type ATPase [Solitalea koreensis]|uniref:Ca2+-transporting ATPase n=1 Tax=Solitalea koreensis TaxID=543615 RepID=A0A521D2Q2_9SPHI|nr:cation-translocating P-type ATPase [Solitalea koreensis]SMO65954.1 Ca2+-transporting ATPase [Solitalea koreensis]